MPVVRSKSKVIRSDSGSKSTLLHLNCSALAMDRMDFAKRSRPSGVQSALAEAVGVMSHDPEISPSELAQIYSP